MASITNPGPYSVSLLIEGVDDIRNGPDYDGATIYYPSNGVPPYAGIAIIPGYGMAVAQAQFVVNEIISILKNKNIEVIFVIHPVAGRMPGHMNVLLAEAQIPYDIVYEMDEVNDDFEKIDLSIVIGANDIVNPSALEDPNSPIAGMPVIECWRGTSTVVMKRGMSTGYAGVENPLFFKENTKMLFGDAKESLSQVLTLNN